MKRYLALLLASLVISCGGGGDGDSPGATPPANDGGSTGANPSASGGGSTGGSPPPSGGGNPGATPPPSGGGGTGDSPPGASPARSRTLPAAGAHVEESDPAVTLSGEWTSTNPGGGPAEALPCNPPWPERQPRHLHRDLCQVDQRAQQPDGRSSVSVDGGPAKAVQLRTGTGLIMRTPAITIYDLSDGPHTLTIEVVSGVVVVDAFDVQPETTVSHWQDTDPNVAFSAGWTKASTALPWSGNGDHNEPELAVTAQETYVGSETVTLPFRGTAISWIGYRGPDGGIAG